MPAIRARTRKSREDWLCHALEVLRNEGIQGVRIEKLAREIGVTKGSFYWHFSDLADLHQCILDYWSAEFTEVVTRYSHLEERDPADAVLQLIHMVREQHLDRYELAIRAWADHDFAAAEMVERIYRDRWQFVSGLFRQIGFTGTALEARARLLLCYLSWEPSMLLDEDAEKREPLMQEVHQLLTTK